MVLLLSYRWFDGTLLCFKEKERKRKQINEAVVGWLALVLWG